jgi:ribosome-associated protein
VGQAAPAGQGKARGRTSAGKAKPEASTQPPEVLARRIAQLALEKKAESVLLLDLHGLSSACDYFVLATGLSELQVKAVAEHIEETLAGESVRPWHVEGRHHRRWILLDYVDVVVHLFHKDARDFYRLENLWADAPRELLTGEGETNDTGETNRGGGANAGAGTSAPGEASAARQTGAEGDRPAGETEPKRKKVPERRSEKRHPQEE